MEFAAKLYNSKVVGAYSEVVGKNVGRDPRYEELEPPPKYNLKGMLESLDGQIAEAYTAAAKAFYGRQMKLTQEHRQQIEGYQQEARKWFLENVARFARAAKLDDLERQVAELAPEFAPLPPLSQEQQKQLEAVYSQADRLEREIKETIACLPGLFKELSRLSREEREILHGTSEQGKDKLGARVDELIRFAELNLKPQYH